MKSSDGKTPFFKNCQPSAFSTGKPIIHSWPLSTAGYMSIDLSYHILIYSILLVDSCKFIVFQALFSVLISSVNTQYVDLIQTITVHFPPCIELHQCWSPSPLCYEANRGTVGLVRTTVAMVLQEWNCKTCRAPVWTPSISKNWKGLELKKVVKELKRERERERMKGGVERKHGEM